MSSYNFISLEVCYEITVSLKMKAINLKKRFFLTGNSQMKRSSLSAKVRAEISTEAKAPLDWFSTGVVCLQSLPPGAKWM